MKALNKPASSLCILRLSAIGDVTHVLPTLNTIRRQWPECKITWIIGKLEYQLVQDIPGVEFIIYDKSQGRLANQSLKAALHGRRFDVLLHMQISLRASLASRMINAGIRIGFDVKRARNFQWLFSNKKIAYVPQQHVLDSFLEFARAMDLTPAKPEWNIPIPESAIQFVRDNVSVDKFVVINPSASNVVRNWSSDNYAAIIDYLYEHYQLATVLSGGPGGAEVQFSQEIAQKTTHPPVIMTGKTSLKQLAALLQQAELAIAPDTGPAHIANAVGTRVIGLYANSNPYRTGPYSSLNFTVNKYPEALWQTYHKKPEQVRWGRRVRRDDVMEFIKIQDVKDKIDNMLK